MFIRHSHYDLSKPASHTVRTESEKKRVFPRDFFTDPSDSKNPDNPLYVPPFPQRRRHEDEFTSDGLVFKKMTTNPDEVAVVSLAGASTAFHVVVPSYTTFLGLKVVAIGAGCFRNARLKKITLPSSLITIEDSAFEGSCLEEIQLPSEVKTIGKRAFHRCNHLVTVDFSTTNIELLPDELFLNCHLLEEITLPKKGIADTGKDVFRGCSSLDSLVNLSEFLIDNSPTIFRGSAIGVTTDSRGVQRILSHMVGVDDSAARIPVYRLIIRGIEVIGSFAMQNTSSTRLFLDRRIRLLHPYALAKKAKVKCIDTDGAVRIGDGFVLPFNDIQYGGTAEQWQRVVKLHGTQLFPVTIHCQDGSTITDVL